MVSDFDIDLEEALLELEQESMQESTECNKDDFQSGIFTESGVFLQSLSECLNSFIATSQPKRKHDEDCSESTCRKKPRSESRLLPKVIPL
jgi:hypothetical protein